MKVYTLQTDHFDSDEVVAVFSTWELAVEAKNSYFQDEYIEILEHEIDYYVPYIHGHNLKCYYSFLEWWDDKNLKEKIFEEKEHYGVPKQDHIEEGAGYTRIWCWAKTKEEATETIKRMVAECLNLLQ
jgi:hypothetical protein